MSLIYSHANNIQANISDSLSSNFLLMLCLELHNHTDVT